MQAKLYNQDGKEAGTTELPDAIFNVPQNSALVKQVVEVERANRRKPLAHTKVRSEVRGGGKKPWKQKGTGRARHGSIRSPLWKGGGTTFGPRNETVFKKHINKKMRRKALFIVLSAKVKDGECVFIDRIQLNESKTKAFSKIIKNFKETLGRSLAFVSSGDAVLERAARNIEKLSVYQASQLNALDLLQKKFLFIPKSAIEVIEKTFLK
ncbi:MAG: 50S ribosomal protein L4 [bacterium]|nr:50S ribosomal protein L4 [bacterium]